MQNFYKQVQCNEILVELIYPATLSPKTTIAYALQGAGFDVDTIQRNRSPLIAKTTMPVIKAIVESV
jgi:hypothetical protein